MNKSIQIFKPGKHVAMSGAALSFSESDLAATAAAYDPAKHEAPLVIGHPKHDDPAYGWVKSLAFADGLEAVPHQIDPAFAEMVDRGAFKKISASFYSPDSPSNPVPGVYYIRHIGFLGAQPPAVKGLRNPEFAETEEGVVEFSEWDDVDNASLWRGLREWIIGKFGQDEADKVVPSYTVKSLEQSAQDELKQSQTDAAATPAPAFSETKTKGDEMSAEDTARLAALELENAKFKKDAADFAEAQATAARTARHVEHVAFAETLVTAGKLLPVNKEQTVALMDNLAGLESVIEFGEGDGKKSLAPLAIYKAQLEALPKVVEFGELAGAGKDTIKTVEFSAPPGFTVDAVQLEIHQKAMVHQAQHKTTYEAALAAVSA